jgi:hypothetical protein
MAWLKTPVDRELSALRRRCRYFVNAALGIIVIPQGIDSAIAGQGGLCFVFAGNAHACDNIMMDVMGYIEIMRLVVVVVCAHLEILVKYQLCKKLVQRVDIAYLVAGGVVHIFFVHDRDEHGGINVDKQE